MLPGLMVELGLAYSFALLLEEAREEPGEVSKIMEGIGAVQITAELRRCVQTHAACVSSRPFS